jgi:carboxymethylenebutenolidase
VTEIQRYLAEEIAEDHADGLVTRREALRRLGLLGLSGAVATSLLAGAVVEQAKALAGRAPRAGSAREPLAADIDVATLQTREITFRGPRGRRLMGAWAPARRARGGVLVIHGNRGLNDSIRAVAG